MVVVKFPGGLTQEQKKTIALYEMMISSDTLRCLLDSEGKPILTSDGKYILVHDKL